jgi:hypothetical protein
MGPGLSVPIVQQDIVFLSEQIRRRPSIPVSHSICFGNGT